MPTTSQITPEQARNALEPWLKEGKDLLYLGFSSGLSGSYNSVRVAARELAEEYPEAQIITVDTLCACLGEGLLVYKAVKMKKKEKIWRKWLNGARKTSSMSAMMLPLMICSICTGEEECQRPRQSWEVW